MPRRVQVTRRFLPSKGAGSAGRAVLFSAALSADHSERSFSHNLPEMSRLQDLERLRQGSSPPPTPPQGNNAASRRTPRSLCARRPLNGERQAADCLCLVCNLFTWEGTAPRQHLLSSMFPGPRPGSHPIWPRGDQGIRTRGLEEEPVVLGLVLLSSGSSSGCGSSLGMGVFHPHRGRMRKAPEALLQSSAGPHKVCVRLGPGL